MFKRVVKQQYEHYIDVKSGDLDVSNQLMFTADIADTVTESNPIVRGRVITLNSEGKFVLGGTEVSGNCMPMPMFAKKNSFDPDVATGAVGAKTGEILATSIVGGKMTAYVATGGFELESSEFNPDPPKPYTPNTALVADEDGIIRPAETDTSDASKSILGIVSVPPFRSKASFNVYGKGNNRICFWTVFIPNRGNC